MTEANILQEDVIRLLDESEPAIRSAMRGFSQQDIDDVKQDAWLKIHDKLDTVKDPAKLPGWIRKVARNTALEFVRDTNRKNRKQEHFESMSDAREQLAISVNSPDFAQAIDDEHSAFETLSTLMPRVESLMANKVTCARAVELITRYFDDSKTAAKAMAVSESVVRQAKREFILVALTISKALDLRQKHQVLTGKVLLQCLPDGEGESGTWIHDIMQQMLELGGPAKASVEELCWRTGYAENSVRQYKAEAEHLARIVASIFNESTPESK
ncbi:RNA polymerase sigma factor [Glutamicibacter sp. AOP5-A2-18]|uniref:RNA polymerase sigma factor n=1 Tax=Glutamicibacter sp. AOP5-A2-18 TaxID=3457656 RepID=UPI0040344791